MSDITPFLFYLILGGSLIGAELLIFNFSVFWFLFAGVGAVIAALVSWLIPEAGWLWSTVTFVVASAIVSAGLYMPLRKWQKTPSDMPGNNAIGKEVDVLEDISGATPGKVNWSGTSWVARLAPNSQPIKTGERAIIASINGIELTVKATLS